MTDEKMEDQSSPIADNRIPAGRHDALLALLLTAVGLLVLSAIVAALNR
jgi:hypothetical protein